LRKRKASVKLFSQKKCLSFFLRKLFATIETKSLPYLSLFWASNSILTVLVSAKIPLVLKSDRQAIQEAVKTCYIGDFRNVRLGRIKNTLEIHLMEVSENLLPEVHADPRMEILSAPYEFAFDSKGDLRQGIP